MAILLLTTVLPACKLYFDPRTTAADASDSDMVGDGDAADAGGFCFGPPAPVTIQGIPPQHHDPALRFDSEEMFYVVSDGANDSRIRRGTRTTSSTEYVDTGLAEIDAANGIGFSDVDPSLTDDGLHLFFLSTRVGGTRRLFQVSRATLTDPFGAPDTRAVGDVFSGDVTGDGLAFYFSSENSSLFVARRVSVTSTFDIGAAEPLGIFGRFPSIAHDELHLVYREGSQIYVHSRASRIEPWSAAQLVPLPLPGEFTDPDLAPDGSMLIVAEATVYKLARIPCP